MTTFTVVPSSATRATRAPMVRSAKFNNQFEQREIDYAGASWIDPGFRNSDLLVWDVVFKQRSSTVLGAIDAFLTNLGGAGKFLWTPPPPLDALGERFYLCDTWSWTHNRGGVIDGIYARFEEQPPLL